jgi:molecular chaperone GrpE
MDEEIDEESATGGREQTNPNPLGSEIAALRQQLEAKEQEASSNYDRLLRQKAELDNFKKRTARERDEAIRFANEALVKDLLPVVDNLERAVAHASGGGNGKPLVEGVELVLRQFLDVLMKHGAVQIQAVGQPFDPAKHEAMVQVESSDHETNSIVEEFQKGYIFRERLLRPALVSVAKASGTKEKKNGESKVENGPSDD